MDIGIQKIDSSILLTYKIVIAEFLVQNELKKVWFFEETFMLADISIKMILRMLFFILSNTNIRFIEKKLE